MIMEDGTVKSGSSRLITAGGGGGGNDDDDDDDDEGDDDDASRLPLSVLVLAVMHCPND